MPTTGFFLFSCTSCVLVLIVLHSASMLPARVEPAIPQASSQTYASDGAATGISGFEPATPRSDRPQTLDLNLSVAFKQSALVRQNLTWLHGSLCQFQQHAVAPDDSSLRNAKPCLLSRAARMVYVSLKHFFRILLIASFSTARIYFTDGVSEHVQILQIKIYTTILLPVVLYGCQTLRAHIEGGM
jgi:hypothetical protein